MAIKQPKILSRQDFDQAIIRLRLSVSEVAKETNVPRAYLTEFRNGDRQLRPEHLAKLRDYFESKGVEFEDEPAQSDSVVATGHVQTTPQTDPDGIQRAVLSIRHLAIDPSITHEQAEAIL